MHDSMHGSVRDGVHRRAPHRVHHLSTRSMARSGFGGTRVRVATRKPRATSCRRRYAYCGYTYYGYTYYGCTYYGYTYYGFPDADCWHGNKCNPS